MSAVQPPRSLGSLSSPSHSEPCLTVPCTIPTSAPMSATRPPRSLGSLSSPSRSEPPRPSPTQWQPPPAPHDDAATVSFGADELEALKRLPPRHISKWVDRRLGEQLRQSRKILPGLHVTTCRHPHHQDEEGGRGSPFSSLRAGREEDERGGGRRTFAATNSTHRTPRQQRRGQRRPRSKYQQQHDDESDYVDTYYGARPSTSPATTSASLLMCVSPSMHVSPSSSSPPPPAISLSSASSSPSLRGWGGASPSSPPEPEMTRGGGQQGDHASPLPDMFSTASSPAQSAWQQDAGGGGVVLSPSRSAVSLLSLMSRSERLSLATSWLESERHSRSVRRSRAVRGGGRRGAAGAGPKVPWSASAYLSRPVASKKKAYPHVPWKASAVSPGFTRLRSRPATASS